jgi:hypothetical protein
MAYTINSPQPALRSTALAYDAIGPGLYDDGEIAVTLDNGLIVAVSAIPSWLEDHSGISIAGYARCINSDGSTKLTVHDQHIETQCTTTLDLGWLELVAAQLPTGIASGSDAPSVAGMKFLADEMMRALLGEPSSLNVSIDGVTVDALHLPTNTRNNINIRKHAALALGIPLNGLDLSGA